MKMSALGVPAPGCALVQTQIEEDSQDQLGAEQLNGAISGLKPLIVSPVTASAVLRVFLGVILGERFRKS